MFRPFPVEEVATALSHLKAVAVLDRTDSVNGAGAHCLQMLHLACIHKMFMFQL